MGFRLLTQLSEKEREYQELLRSSVQRKQEQIDALRKAAVAEGNAVNHTVELVDSPLLVIYDKRKYSKLDIFISISTTRSLSNSNYVV